MDNIPDLKDYFYGSASREFLAAKCELGDFLRPISRKERRRVRKKLEKIMMLQNLSCSPPKPIMKIAGMNLGFAHFNKKRGGSFGQDDDV